VFITSLQDAKQHGYDERVSGFDHYRLVDAEVCGALVGTVTLDVIHTLEPGLWAPGPGSSSVVLDGCLRREGGTLPRKSVLLGGRGDPRGWGAATPTAVLTVHSRAEAVSSASPSFFDLDDVADTEAHRPALGFFDMKARMLVDGTSEGTRSFTLGLGTFAPGTGCHALHRHSNADEFFYLWEGRGAHLTGDGLTHSLKAGELVYVPRNEWHGFQNTGPTPARALFGYLGVDSRSEAGYEVLQPC
jgi:quercetin dioxygenase-like cupin family protein